MPHLRKELEHLKRRLLTLSGLAEESVRRAVRAVESRDASLAAKVIAADRDIDTMEVDVEEDCLKILALHQPVAIDLRFIIAVLKMNNDLERIGDLAVNIAERAEYLAGKKAAGVPVDLPAMAAKAQKMLRQSLDAVVNMDTKLARAVLAADDEVDQENRDVHELVKREISQDPTKIDELMQLLLVSRHIERIADQATNIAEDAIYMVEGEIVRHNRPVKNK